MINQDIFFPKIRASLFRGHLTDEQVGGVKAIVAEWEKLMPKGDLRYLAYMFATVFHETGTRMVPVDEIGHGRGKKYGIPTGPWHQVYYGRGDVQLTFEANYRHATQRLRALGVIGNDVDLEKNPELADRPDIAAAILFYGMIEGWFTSRKLGQYFTATTSDPVNARRIINILDCAEIIAGYYRSFYAALAAARASNAA